MEIKSSILSEIEDKLLKSSIYVPILVLLTFVFWIFAWDARSTNTIYPITTIGLTFFGVLLILVLIFFEDTTYTIPILFSLCFVFGSNQMSLTVITLNDNPILIIMMFLVLVSFIFHIIYFKVSFKNGSLKIGLLLIAIGYILPFSLSDKTDPTHPEIVIPIIDILPSYILMTLTGTVFLFVYLFYVNSAKSLNTKYILNVLMLFGFLITAQALSEYIRFFIRYSEEMSVREILEYGIISKWEGDTSNKIEGLTFGWGVHNDGALMMAFFLPGILYNIVSEKKNFLVPVLFVEIAACMLLMSRGVYISLFIIICGSIFLIIKKGTKSTKIWFLSCLSLSIVILAINYQVILYVVERFSKFSEDIASVFNGRFQLYQLALDEFVKRPFVGGSAIAIVDYQYRGIVFHSTFFHAIGCFGLFGLSALIIHFIQAIKMIKLRKGLNISFIVIGILATQIHGLIDNTFYALLYTGILMILYVAIEKNSIEITEEVIEV